MTACSRCGFDPDAKVTASWSFTIDRAVVSLNERGTNRGAWTKRVPGKRTWNARRAYKADRDAWGWLVKAKRLELRIPKAKGRRRLTLTRLYGKGQRAFDRDNLVGGMKPVVDSMVLDGLLLGDTPELAEVHYDQIGSEPGAERAIGIGLLVVLEDVA